MVHHLHHNRCRAERCHRIPNPKALQEPSLQLGWDGRGEVLQGRVGEEGSYKETCGLRGGLQPPQKAKLRRAEMLRPGAEFLLSKSAFISQERKKKTNRERQKWEGKRKIPNGKWRSLILFKRNIEQHKGVSEPGRAASALRKSHRVSPAPNPSPSKRQRRACVTSKQSCRHRSGAMTFSCPYLAVQIFAFCFFHPSASQGAGWALHPQCPTNCRSPMRAVPAQPGRCQRTP